MKNESRKNVKKSLKSPGNFVFLFLFKPWLKYFIDLWSCIVGIHVLLINAAEWLEALLIGFKLNMLMPVYLTNLLIFWPRKCRATQTLLGKPRVQFWAPRQSYCPTLSARHTLVIFWVTVVSQLNCCVYIYFPLDCRTLWYNSSVVRLTGAQLPKGPKF